MGSQHHLDASVRFIVPVLEKFHIFRQLGRRIRRITNQAPGQGSPETGLLYHTGSFIHKKVHIRKSRGAALQHLQDCQLAPPVNSVAVQVSFRRPDHLIQPVHERHVVGITS